MFKAEYGSTILGSTFFGRKFIVVCATKKLQTQLLTFNGNCDYCWCHSSLINAALG